MICPGLRLILAVYSHQQIHQYGHGPKAGMLQRFLERQGAGVRNQRRIVRQLRELGFIVTTRDQSHDRIELTDLGRQAACDLVDVPDLEPELVSGTKVCSVCGEERNLSEFYPVRSSEPTGQRQARCNACDAARSHNAH